MLLDLLSTSIFSYHVVEIDDQGSLELWIFALEKLVFKYMTLEIINNLHAIRNITILSDLTIMPCLSLLNYLLSMASDCTQPDPASA